MRIQNLLNILRTNKMTSSNKFNYFEYYENITGKSLAELQKERILKKDPKIKTMTQTIISSILQVLDKFKIFEEEAVLHPHLFTMNPITLDNYGMVLEECGFLEIKPMYIIRYHTLVRSHNISQLKRKGCLPYDTKLSEKLLKCFSNWPESHSIKLDDDADLLSILQTRLKILQKYLNWRLGVTEKEFLKYCKNYRVIKHRPFADIQEAINIAHFELNFSIENIKNHGFLISADPTNTKLILENVPKIAGTDIREILRAMPAIIKNNYESINRIREILEEFRISDDIQLRSLPVYCMCPETVLERLTELSKLDEFQALKGNPRLLTLVVYKNKMMRRLARLKASNKHCFSLDSLVASRKIFEVYTNKFGDNIGGRDVACVVFNELQNEVERHTPAKLKLESHVNKVEDRGIPNVTRGIRVVTEQLRRHAYWRNAPTTKVAHNLSALRKMFADEDVYLNCHLLLYPTEDLINMINKFKQHRSDALNGAPQSCDWLHTTIDYKMLNDRQLLALTLYTIERKHHFTGDGIWGSGDKSTTTLS